MHFVVDLPPHGKTVSALIYKSNDVKQNSKWSGYKILLGHTQ